jgi:hypothetical protein
VLQFDGKARPNADEPVKTIEKPGVPGVLAVEPSCRESVQKKSKKN